jgi:hypothetical protein
VTGTVVAVIAEQGGFTGELGLQIGPAGFADDEAAAFEPLFGRRNRQPVAFPMEGRGGAAHRLGNAQRDASLAQGRNAERNGDYGADHGEQISGAEQVTSEKCG